MKAYIKKADISQGRVIIPKEFLKKWGNEVYMEVDINTGVIGITALKLIKKDRKE